MNSTTLPNPPPAEHSTAAAETQPHDATARAAGARVAELQPRLAQVLELAGASDARELLRSVFAHASHVLANVRRVRQELEQEGAPGAVTTLLKEVSAESRQLLAVVETAELRVENLADELRETFDSVAFAMGHELRRVFAEELARRDGEGGRPRPTVSRVIRACGLVENCLQQSVITLAKAVDPSVTGVTVFADYRERRENSLALRAELASLAESVKSGEGEPSVLSNISVLRRVRRFRYEHMHLLMYRDWEEFERFADAMEESYESVETFAELLHTFSCYLTTLHGQVSLRAVLSDG